MHYQSVYKHMGIHNLGDNYSIQSIVSQIRGNHQAIIIVKNNMHQNSSSSSMYYEVSKGRVSTFPRRSTAHKRH